MKGKLWAVILLGIAAAAVLCAVLLRPGTQSAEVKILVVKDSFANSVAPFLALCVKQIDILDPRWFKGSIRSYIKKTQPDIVLVIHTMELDYPLERDSHQDDYDFR